MFVFISRTSVYYELLLRVYEVTCRITSSMSCVNYSSTDLSSIESASINVRKTFIDSLFPKAFPWKLFHIFRNGLEVASEE